MSPTAQSNPKVTLRCFGVGEGWPCHNRRHSSYLYRFADVSLLFDCGDGLSSAYQAGEFSYDEVDHVFLSHMHSDHVGGFSLFVQGLWLEQRQHALPVHMPGGGVPAMKAWLEATILPEDLIGFPIDWEALTPGVEIRAGDVSVTPFHTTHLDSLRRSFQAKHPATSFEAFSFLLEAPGLRIAHTADIGEVADLAPLLAQPLDLLVCELSHIDPELLFAELRGKPIRQIVFIHLSREFWDDLPGTRLMMETQLGGIPFSIPNDGDEFTVLQVESAQ